MDICCKDQFFSKWKNSNVFLLKRNFYYSNNNYTFGNLNNILSYVTQESPIESHFFVVENTFLPLVSIFVMMETLYRNIYKDLIRNTLCSNQIAFPWLYQAKRKHNLAVGKIFQCDGNSHLRNEKYLHHTKK